jgi:bacterioferritin B
VERRQDCPRVPAPGRAPPGPQLRPEINGQIGREFAASLEYVSIASGFASEGLTKLAKYFYRQAEEERDHAMRFVKYVVDAGGKMAIPAIPAPKSAFTSAEEAVRNSLEWEVTVTKHIDTLVDLAIQETDHTTQNSLQWFVTEQLEEVSSMETLLSVVRRAGESGLLTVEAMLARTACAENS